MINDFLFQYFYELLNLFSNVEIYKWNKGNELTCIWLYVSKIFVWYLWSGTCTPSPFLKNEIDKCVGYEKKQFKNKAKENWAISIYALSIKSNANVSIFSHNYQRILFNQLICKH